jgi:Abnormal spindle-like microcephaly-assoc'd, ASPM-SPD-2-Hydin
VPVNTTANITVQLSNSSTVSTVHGKSIGVSSPFTLASHCPASLAPNANCSVTVSFKPTATGTKTGTLTFSDDAAGSPQSLSVSGTGS